MDGARARQQAEPRRRLPTRNRSGPTTQRPASSSATSTSATPPSRGTARRRWWWPPCRTAATRGRRGTSARRTTSLRNSGDSRAARSGPTPRASSTCSGRSSKARSSSCRRSGLTSSRSRSTAGRRWTRPMDLYRVTDPCYFVDPVIFRCMMDGVAGARNDLAAAPSVDIANGAPTGVGATNLIVNTWADGRDGLNNEDVAFSHSSGGGLPGTWSAPRRISDGETAGLRGAGAVAGRDGCVRRLQRVHDTVPKRHHLAADPRRRREARECRGRRSGGIHDASPRRPGRGTRIGPEQPPGGVPRRLRVRSRLAGLRGGGLERRPLAADCPAIDAWRMSLWTATTADDVPTPAPQVVCPPTFGNTGHLRLVGC